ncbi:PD40 domain-containing protein [bacterium]|nr:PD40 domain-containing protein [bacterium]
MKWTRKRFLLLPYVALLAILVVVGCTSKEDPSETLTTCGNHSCGDLVMVTTDTSSDGFHYLNASLSPDGSQILFSADWKAMPSDPRDPGDELYTSYRQLVVIPIQEGTEPTSSLADQGATLIRLFPQNNVWYKGRPQYIAQALDDDKAYPLWEDDQSVIFCLRSQEYLADNYRLFRVDISNPDLAPFVPLFMEPEDFFESPAPPFSQHLEPTLSPAGLAMGRWLVFTRSSCALVDSFETCTGTALWALDMNTAGDNFGYDTTFFPLTNEYSRLENPRFSPDGRKIIFSGGMDVSGAGTGAGTELFTIDFDTTGLDAGTMPLDRNLKRLTFTAVSPGDPISGIFNSNPVYSNDGRNVYFISTRRAPSITLHDRNVWRIPADGSLDPVIHYFTRSDEADPSIMPDGRMLLSSALGFPTEMLNRLEEEAYQRLVVEEPDLTEVQLREAASEERRQLEFFEGVMSHIYIYRP